MKYFAIDDLINSDISAEECISITKYLGNVEEVHNVQKKLLLTAIKNHEHECTVEDCTYRKDLLKQLKKLNTAKSNLISARSKLLWMLKQESEPDDPGL